MCCYAFTPDDNLLLLGLASRLAFFDLASGEFTPVCAVEAGLPTRVNDGRCDRQGRFVFGTMDQSAPRQAIGAFYRVNHDLSLEKLPLPGIAIANSICFSPDGSSMYFTDSMRQAIYRWSNYDSATAPEIAVFAAVGPGAADGACIDADGYLWSAQWGAARVVRYAPDGKLERSLALPVSQPSCVCLGGPLFDELFVTTARENLGPAALAGEPLAGGVFHARQDELRGLPENRFMGAFRPA